MPLQRDQADIRDIRDLDDHLGRQVVAMYEESFPPEERIQSRTSPMS